MHSEHAAPSCLNQKKTRARPHTLNKHKPAFLCVCHFSSSPTPRRHEGIKALVANVFKSVRYLGGIREEGAAYECNGGWDGPAHGNHYTHSPSNRCRPASSPAAIPPPTQVCVYVCVCVRVYMSVSGGIPGSGGQNVHTDAYFATLAQTHTDGFTCFERLTQNFPSVKKYMKSHMNKHHTVSS